MTTKKDSFLDETQLEGRASGKFKIENLDQAINSVSKILDDELCNKIKETPEDKLPTTKISVYCHDCREIVPAGIGQTLKGNPRTICGKCNSKKISMGREEALRKFYHLEKKV